MLETIVSIFLIVVLCVVFLVLLGSIEKPNLSEEAKTLIIKNTEDKIKEQKNKIDKKVVDKKQKYIFYIDKKEEKIFFLNIEENKAFDFGFKDIVDFEIIEDKEVVFKGSTGGIVAGGLLYGGMGALAGANIEKKLIEKCFLLKLKIYFNNIDNPEINMNFLTKAVKRNSLEYREAKEDAEAFASILRVVVSAKEKKE